MPTASEQRQFLHSYGQFVVANLNPLRLRLRGLLEEWRAPTYWDAYRRPPLPTPSPVLRTSVRVKRAEAVVDQILRSQDEFPAGLSLESVKRMGNLLGGRIVVSFVPHLMLVDQEIRERDDLCFWKKRKPRAYLRTDDTIRSRPDLKNFELVPKQWGAAALIYWLRFVDDDGESYPFELQVVTLMDDVWGDIQRQLGHRSRNEMMPDDIRERFSELGAMVSDLDSRLTGMYEELIAYQQLDGLGSDDTQLNAENLPRVLNQVHIQCAQIELEGMLKVLTSRGVVSVGDLLSRATPTAVSSVKATYIDEAGWPPSSFEVVATLAMVSPKPDTAEVVAAARLNMEYLEAWDETLRESQAYRDDRREAPARRGSGSLGRLLGN